MNDKERAIAQVPERIQNALGSLMQLHSFFASPVLKRPIILDPTCHTAWTNGVRIGINPEFVTKLPNPQLETTVGHEGVHIMAKHDLRRGDRDPTKWNKAADYEANIILQKAGFEPIEGWLCDMQYDGFCAEEIFDKMPDGDGDGTGDPGNECAGGNEGNSENESEQGDSDGDNDGQGEPKGKPKPFHGNIGEVRDNPGESGKGMTEQERQTAEADRDMENVANYNVAKSAGNLPGGLERFVDHILNPKIAWADLLREHINTKVRDDYSWRRPNRRFVQQGLYMPNLDSNQIGEIGVFMDTSGSVGQDALNQFASEVSSILEELQGVTVHLLPVDYDVHKPQILTQNDLPLKAEISGGGGTSFAKPFDFIEENGIDLKCAVYLTDGWCSHFPDYEPNYPVIWVVTQDDKFDPPFGDVIQVKI